MSREWWVGFLWGANLGLALGNLFFFVFLGGR